MLTPDATSVTTLHSLCTLQLCVRSTCVYRLSPLGADTPRWYPGVVSTYCTSMQEGPRHCCPLSFVSRGCKVLLTLLRSRWDDRSSQRRPLCLSGHGAAPAHSSTCTAALLFKNSCRTHLLFCCSCAAFLSHFGAPDSACHVSLTPPFERWPHM